MRIGDDKRDQLLERLELYSMSVRRLPGAATTERRFALTEQLIDSIRRIYYIRMMREREISPLRTDPASLLFDPLRAAVLEHNAGNIDEAFWLTFLATHCGRHAKDGWRLARDLYHGNGSDAWTWTRVSGNPSDFHNWLSQSYPTFKNDGVTRRFGNHRKYETLRPDSNRGTSSVVASYVTWVGANRGHSLLINEAQRASGSNPEAAFEYLYRSMASVTSFGRTGRFDYLTMVGKLGLANIEPGKPYLDGATGPLSGARLLFGESVNAPLDWQALESFVIELGSYLGLGMQAMEDALWSPVKKSL